MEELDPWPDPDGYIRYSISDKHINSIVSIDTTIWERPCMLSEEDAWDYYEKIHYPEFNRVFSEDSIFTSDELELIRQCIGKQVISINS